MRNNFINWLIAKSRSDNRIFLLTADLGYSVVEPFQQVFPDQFINVGVAEQNMTGIAAGLATEGFLPFTYSIGVFPTFRCAEQIRNDIDYHNLPVVTCTVGSGVAYGNLGYSHHAIQDISIMRSLPNMVIATPADPSEVVAILDWYYSNPCPMYLRLHKAGEPQIPHSLKGLKIGSLQHLNQDIVRANTPAICIIVIGFLSKRVLEVAKDIPFQIDVYCLSLWGQPGREEFAKEISRFETIITVEDHILEGGLASYTMEIVSTLDKNIKVIPVALTSETVGKVASEKTLLDPLFKKLRSLLYGLNL